MEQKDYWNRAAADKEFTTPFQLAAFEKSVTREAVVLDVGCGYGRTLDELYRAGWRSLIGVDFSEAMIERGRAAYPHLDLRVKRSAEKIDLPDASVDAVILFAVLTCISSNAEQERMISEIRRVLRPGGIPLRQRLPVQHRRAQQGALTKNSKINTANTASSNSRKAPSAATTTDKMDQSTSLRL